jgi:hypothetical protein
MPSAGGAPDGAGKSWKRLGSNLSLEQGSDNWLGGHPRLFRSDGGVLNSIVEDMGSVVRNRVGRFRFLSLMSPVHFKSRILYHGNNTFDRRRLEPSFSSATIDLTTIA